MKKTELAKGIYWVGAVDWNARNFHGYTYSTHRGTTYNAYLIVDDKTAIVDTVYGPFAKEMLERISEIIDIKKIDYVVSNHVETDHSGALPALMEFIPDVPLVCTQKGKEGLFKHYFKDWNFKVVKTSDEINLGERTLKFIETPMLHWPDSMFTYIESDELLLSNDAFGQHIASSFRFADELEEAALMEEAVKYYANILMPFGALILRKIDEIVKSGIKIKTIAPSHGVIWRGNPERIINAYLDWAEGKTNDKVVVVYDTMWESTKKMAEGMAEGIMNQGLEAKLYRLSTSDRSDVITELLEAKGILVGSSTINRDILPTVAPFLEDLKGLKPKRKIAGAFGSYGWSGGAVEKIKESLKEAGIEVIDDLAFKYVPDSEEIKKCFEFGERFAIKIKQAG